MINFIDENETKAITKAVLLYFLGAYQGDAEKIKQAFHPDAHIQGSIDELQFDWTLSDFIARVTMQPTAAAKGENYDKNIVSIDRDDDTATVKARVVAGDRVFHDDISLIKEKGNWIISNKRFTAEPRVNSELEEENQ